jgi:hypothetical protein
LDEEARLRRLVREEVARAIDVVALTGRASLVDSERQAQPVELQKPQDWFFIELWTENRQFFKEFIAHSFFFGLFILSLDLFHRYLSKTSLEPHEKELLNKFHFYGTAIAVVIFGVSFVIGGIRNRFWKGQR